MCNPLIQCRWHWRRAAPLLPLFAVAALMGCEAVPLTASTAPVLVSSPLVSQFRDAAFVLDVNTVQKRITVASPASRAGNAVVGSLPALDAKGSPVSRSLLGGDAIEIAVSNYRAGVIGATVPGKVLVTFDLTLINRLTGLRLITPTFPAPPAGITGVQAFPLEVTVLTTGGTASGSGNGVVVTTPRFGTATASTDWDGAPHNFFNDAACRAADNDCFRYEPFGTIEPRANSAPRQVGLLIDPTVGDVRVRIIVAADLQAQPRS